MWPADATPPPYTVGDTTHTAHEHFLPMLNLAQIILSAFYVLTYIVNHVFKTSYFIIVRWVGRLCAISFVKLPPGRRPQKMTGTCRRPTMLIM